MSAPPRRRRPGASSRGRKPTAGPPRPAGSTTRASLLGSAAGLFARRWFNTVSVAEICRAAGLSNGVFYRYFDDKEEVFRALLADAHERLEAGMARAERAAPGRRLQALVGALLRFHAEHPDHAAILLEGPYRLPDFQRRLEATLRASLGRLVGGEVGHAASLFALGGLRFCAARHARQDVAVHAASLARILERGLFPGLEAAPERVFAGPVVPLPLDLEEGGAERLLAAGKRLVGDRGYFETSVHQITDAAGLSVGAFYVHFDSKEELFAALIRRAGQDVRRFIAANLAPPGGPAPANRLERELRGLWLFELLVQSDPRCYRLVREAEFALPREVRRYYAAFVEGYRHRPLAADGLARGLDEATAIEFLLGLGHQLGIESVFLGAPGSPRTRVEAIERYLRAGLGGPAAGRRASPPPSK